MEKYYNSNGKGMPIPVRKLLRTMKLIAFIMLLSLLQVSAASYSQTAKLNLSFDNAHLKEVFKMIESSSSYSIFYKEEIIEESILKNGKYKNASINKILDEVLKNEGLSYRIDDHLIVIYTDKSKEVVTQTDRKVSGIVTDVDGEVLPGVSVIVKGTTIGVTTDFDGKYTLEVPGSADVLVFSFIGMKTEEVVLEGQTTVNLRMTEETIGLQEVVAVGFGVQKKSSLTGSTSTVKVEEVLGNRPVTNTIQALQGALPGVQITTNSGQPGEKGLGINVRGFTSINGGGPLILMDNVPVSSEDINPQDVESVTVLKDASASAIYGARAAFGVVLITTKKAKKNQPIKFNFSSTFSFSDPTDIPEKASVYDFVHALNDWGVDSYWTGQDIDTWVNFTEEYRNNPSLYPEGMAYDDNGLHYPLKEGNLIDVYFSDPGFSQIHNLNFSGGTPKTAYRVSVGYSNEDGIILTNNDSYEKYTLKTYVKSDLTSKLTSSIDIGMRRSKKKSPIGSYSKAIGFKSWTPAEGNYVFDDGTEMPYETPANLERLNPAPKTLVNNVRILGTMEYKPIKDLVITGEYTFETGNKNIERQNNQIETVNPERLTINGVDPEQTYFRKDNQQFTYNAINLYARYTKSFADHNFVALGGINNEERNSENFWVQKKNLISVDLPSISTATGLLEGGDSFGEWAVWGAFGRLNYNYKEKYFLEASGRYDGSSKFPSDDRYGFFPSFSVGWNLKKEGFMKNVDKISLLKLRGSLGEIGNQSVGNYVAIPGMEVYDVSWLNPNSGLKYNSLDVPSLVSSGFTWERVKTTNVGVDLNAWNGRFSTSFDVFKRETIGMLTPGAQLPDVLGAPAPKQNAADLESKGWELEVKWRDQINDFSYSVGFTLFDSQAEITKFDNEAGLLNQYYIGRKIGEIWGYETEGYYTVDDFVEGTLDDNLMNGTLKDGVVAFKGRNPNPGDIKYKNLNGDDEIFQGDNTLENPGDRKVIGNTTRRYQYGIFGSASYRNFDFSFMLNGVGKRDIWQNNVVRFPYRGEFEPMYAHQMDYWTPENTDAYYPRNYELGGVNYGNSRQTQTKYLLNGAYLNIKNITLGYAVPKVVLQRWGISKLRLYASVENLHSFNDWPKGINTELKNKGNGATYPLLKTYSFGLNLTF
ncbi:SusC/RagA family TonB-linked outer membrane protein [Puteibacter caeruleilacunae]|nr:SusC/RagA family TonB-linked outer membrane protein [Puteibacter caeruleilacunae]